MQEPGNAWRDGPACIIIPVDAADCARGRPDPLPEPGQAMDSIALLIDELRRSFHGNAWHGPAIGEVLADVRADEAIQRPIAAHSIWEIALHATGWIEEVTRRLGGGEPSLPERGDWPAIDDDGEEAWAGTLAALHRAHETLEASLSRFPSERLGDLVGSASRDAPLGTGVTFAQMLHGLAQHNAYHAGQVALLKGALRRRGQSAPSSVAAP